MTVFEAAAIAAEVEDQKVEIIDAAPSVIRSLRAKRIARAVLLAIREPSSAVIDEGMWPINFATEYESEELDRQSVRTSLQYMIDAILAGK